MEDMIEIKIKKLRENARMPSHSEGDVGYDLYTSFYELDTRKKILKAYSGLAIEPPEGYHVELFPRSSINKKELLLCNSVGLIDQPYRGELIACYRWFGTDEFFNDGGAYKMKDGLYTTDEKFIQIVIRKTILANFVEVSELSETKRGTGGFGSTGK